ncbi:MAG: PilZ domain-containing protein [Syntrophomonas sp.]
MKIKGFVSKFTMTLLGLLFTFVLTSPGQAANRNDALFDLKDTFNSPIADKVSGLTLVLIVITCIAIVMIFRYNFSRDEKVQRAAREMYREKQRSQSAGQKRNWFRLKTDAEFKWIAAHLADSARESQYNIDQLIDISGGGLSFSTFELLNPADEINMILPTGGSNPLSIDGRVIRAVPSDDSFHVSIQYIGLLDGQRDKLVAWIQKNQRNAMFVEKQEENATEENAATSENADKEEA